MEIKVLTNNYKRIDRKIKDELIYEINVLHHRIEELEDQLERCKELMTEEQLIRAGF